MRHLSHHHPSPPFQTWPLAMENSASEADFNEPGERGATETTQARGTPRETQTLKEDAEEC
jgi:hypothetical protein